MAMKINFGWLHDFSGNKFAPFTLADKILLNRRGTETVTFLDYFDNKMDNLEAHQTENQNDLTELKKFKVLLTKSPFEIESILQDDTIGEREWAYGAKMLLETPQWEIGEDGRPRDQGVARGSGQIPVYFKNGIPEGCNQASIRDNLTQIDASTLLGEIKGPIPLDKTYNFINYSNLSQDSQDDGPFGNALLIDISGTAKKADESAHAAVSDMSYQSLQTHYSNFTYGFVNSIIFGAGVTDQDKKDDNDIHGQIITQTENNNNTITNTAQMILNAVDPILEGTKYGDSNKLYQNISYFDEESAPGKHVIGGVKNNITIGGSTRRAMTLPVLEVDKKGRIRSIKEEIAFTVINLDQYDKQSGKAGLVCWTGSTEDANLLGCSTDASTGIYVEWPDDQAYPVLKGAAYNDYAEYRRSKGSIPAGYCVASNDKGEVYKTSEKFQACDGIVSNTFGIAIGSEFGSIPLAVAGRVLAYYEGDINNYHSGDTVCAGPEGKVCKMTREEIKEYPDRIVGIVSEIPDYEEWNGVKVNNRIWIKVK